jgi:hypothetical protein
MRTAYLATLVAASVASASAANAATIVVPNDGPDGTKTFALASTPNSTIGAFEEIFNFTLPSAGFLSLSLTDVAINPINNLEFTEILFNGTAVAASFFSAPGGEPDLVFFTGLPAGAGSNSLTVRGTNGGNGSFGGSLSFTPATVAAIPEPATWAMMLGGFGMVGGAMRARRRKERVTVSYA